MHTYIILAELELKNVQFPTSGALLCTVHFPSELIIHTQIKNPQLPIRGCTYTPFSHSKPIYFRVESATTPSSYPTVVHPHLANITAMTRNKSHTQPWPTLTAGQCRDFSCPQWRLALHSPATHPLPRVYPSSHSPSFTCTYKHAWRLNNQQDPRDRQNRLITDRCSVTNNLLYAILQVQVPGAVDLSSILSSLSNRSYLLASKKESRRKTTWRTETLSSRERTR